MARVKFQKARKDYPAAGIVKGDMYYYARVMTGPRSSKEIRQKNPIRPSQLTSSAFLQGFYGLQERLEVFDGPLSDMSDFLEGVAGEARELGEEEQGKYDNMPEGLQQGSTGELLEERANAMEAWADSLETAATEATEKAEEFARIEELWKDHEMALAELEQDEEEPAEPDEERLDEQELIEEVKGEIEEPSL